MAFQGQEDPMAQQGDVTSWGQEGWDDTNNQIENIEHSDQEEVEDQPTIAVDPVPRSSSGDSASVDEDSGDYDPEYDPESVAITTAVPAPAVERSASAASSRLTKKPKSAGGFIVGSSDDEDDDTPAPIAAPAPAPAPQPAPGPAPVSVSPTNKLKPVPANTQTRPFSPSTHQPTIPQQVPTDVGNNPAAGSSGPGAPALRSRLPTDVMGMLEDRIKEDPRGDMDAWLALIDEQKRRHRVEDTRAVYERFLAIFPQAAEMWVAYVDMELSMDNFPEAEAIFQRTLLSIPHVKLWTAYLNYIRRRNDLLNDSTGQARQTVKQSYDFVLANVGQDRDAGTIWQEYIQFLKSGPGQIGGSGWQDQQKMDLLRNAYQRAICIPIPNLNVLWKEYDQFELGLNKMTGRKFLQERSPSYMTARTANTALENTTRGLHRTTLPRLPPAPGFDGDQDFVEQVDLWKAWIAWEKEDPLVLKSEDLKTYRSRILYVYKQSLMALRFWPELWVDAAEWCFENQEEGQNTGLQFLVDGIAANPESSLLALKHADYIESTQRASEDDEAKAALAQAVRAPYDKVLDTLYDMIKRLKDRETAAVAEIEAETTADGNGNQEDDDDEGEIMEQPQPNITKQIRIKAIQSGFSVQIQELSQQISYLWIALARTFRRLQGQGKSSPPTGVRGIFTEARQKGRLTSDVYLAIAHIEWDIYQDPVATKIFERGSKLFPEQEYFIVEYIKHLHARRDFTNARVVFSQTVKRFKEKPELLPRLKPLYAYFHSYEAKFGELTQVKDLEKQMNELFPNDTSVEHFAARFATDRFNPLQARVIVSLAQQMRPKTVMQSVEQHTNSIRSTPRPTLAAQRSPRPQFLPATNSPKRPYQADDQDDYNPPRKMARGVSPLKGAAGRRLDQQRRAGASVHTSVPAPIPRDITFLLGLIPSSDNFGSRIFNSDGMVRLIRDTTVPDYTEWKNRNEASSTRATHTRQTSSADYPPYSSHPPRDSPGPSGGRPQSPYGGGVVGRAVPAQVSAAPYRNSPLRPGSSGSYEPPPPALGYQGPGPSQFNPLGQPPANAVNYSGWSQHNYAQAAPNAYGMQQNQQPPQYGGYY